ncbi:tetratricopeptide repeat protein [Aquimarina sp. SS2-1]|uniref:tetratricopeptide repeat protein n=1 Tax=Aquimarina besae TaxID=3342247 RepID=UPI0036707245
MNQIPKKKTLYFLIIMVIVTTITYLNHFDNAFHFDDMHTIVENPNIRSLKNIPNFFTDGTTISSLPQNQAYRPILTISLAIDYWLGNGYDLFYFHLSSFILFLIQGVLLFFFAFRILNISNKDKFNFYIAGAITVWYMIHPAMAETINYIIARSDLQSTFFVILAFVLYQYSKTCKKYYLYLIPVIIGALSKPTAIMFAPLFVIYVGFFEEEISFRNIIEFSKKSKLLRVIKVSSPSIMVCAALYIFQGYMTPNSFSTGSSETFRYLITQPYVIFYYFGSLFLPIHLSADTDWTLLENIWSFKFFFGIFFLIILIVIAILTFKKKSYYPITFGILWFFIALAPTSSFIPLAEVMNDHRMFFPYIGLTLAVGYSIWLLIGNLKKRYKFDIKYAAVIISTLLTLYGFGTYQRNIVWHDEESLWKDVTIKSPKNGRGLMNYGLTKMAKGEYQIAEEYFIKALKYTPNYHTLHINLGILNNAKGNKKEAEKYFENSIKYGPGFHSSWFYYGRYFSENQRNKEAISKLNRSLEISPNHIPTRLLLMENYLELENWNELNKLAQNTLLIDKENKKAQSFLLASVQKINKLDLEENEIQKNPTPEKYLDLSLKYYQNGLYQKCILAAEKALKLNKDFAAAYNNICIAQNLLGNFDKAVLACDQAIELNPNFQLAKNNLQDVLSRKSKIDELTKSLEANPSEANYLNVTLAYYNYGLFNKCITLAEEGITKHPTSDNLYNNLCASFNAIKQWKKAIDAGKKGLGINPQNTLLRNNYNYALSNSKQ